MNVKKAGPGKGCLIVNADDWGRDRENTDCAFECFRAHALSSVSAMVFVDDSERAASIAREHAIDAGLHLNLTMQFADNASVVLRAHQAKVASYLTNSRMAQALFHPGLTGSFAYVVAAQIEEFERLYGCRPGRIDGHHHMHLAANVIFAGLLPEGTALRRNFSFFAGEKNALNLGYRRLLDAYLGRKHPLTDYFFSLPPLRPWWLERMAELARTSVVEAETHPVNQDERDFLCGGGLHRWVDTVAPEFVTSRFARGHLAASHG